MKRLIHRIREDPGIRANRSRIVEALRAISHYEGINFSKIEKRKR